MARRAPARLQRTRGRPLIDCLAAAILSLLFVCLGPAIARATSCDSHQPNTSFPFTAGQLNPFPPGGSRTTHFPFDGVAGDKLTFVAMPGPPGTSQISLISTATSATLATITVSSSASYTLTARDAAGFLLKFTNNTGANQVYLVNCIPAASTPSVAGVSPNSGSVAGGTRVTIAGTNFTGATAVTFGGAAATAVSVVSATSITATTPAHAAGLVDVVVTTPSGSGTGSGLYTYVVPGSTSLASSANPSVFGQPVTFTATVNTIGPTGGTVTFKDGATTLGNGAINASRQATFTTSSLAPGIHLITATFSGDKNFPPSTSDVLQQTVNVPADSLKARALQNQIAPIVATTSGQVITGAIDGAIGDAFSGGSGPIIPNANGVTFNFAGEPQRDSRVEQAYAALGYSAKAGTVTETPPMPVQQRDWHLWLDLQGTGWTVGNNPGSDLQGKQLNVTAGLSHKLTPDFLVGVVTGAEAFKYDVASLQGTLKGDGATIGSYAAWRMGEGLRFDTAVAWSDIGYSVTAGTANGKFNGSRWLGSAGLTGTYALGAMTLQPSAKVFVLRESENAWTDSLGILQDARTFMAGRASAGIKIIGGAATTPWPNVTFAPYVGIYGDFRFSSDNALPVGQPALNIRDGLSWRGMLGSTLTGPGGMSLSVGGELGGLGSNFRVWSANIRGSVPLGSFAAQAPGGDVVRMPVYNGPVPDLWWFHGYIDAGGRFFLNNPPRDGSISNNQKSLAKYYEYSSVKPGPFLYGHWTTGSNDGLYQIDTWADNVGYSDQNYHADVSKAGEHYLSLEWDQTPHIYSTSAQTLYRGVGTTALTLPPGLSNKLFTDSGNSISIDPANAALVQKDIQQNTVQTDIGIRRDTASVDYRYTPNSSWDMRFNYSDTRRTGTQVDGIVMSPNTFGVRADVAKPVADTTRNFGVNGEYEGTSPWGQTFTFKLAYNGSIYKNDHDSYTVENPFCPAGAVNNTCASVSSPVSRVSLAPDNRADTVTAVVGARLPADSRYMGTVSYTMMRQNQAFLPFTVTPFGATGGVPADWAGGMPPTNSIAGLPAPSLNGTINTFVSNNVLTTQITPTLKSKLSYRYYDFANDTPEILFRDWVLADAASAKSFDASYAPVSSLTMSYNKQDAGADLNWRPSREWNFGAAYGYERYSWRRADVNVTNENSGKVYADWKPAIWLTARGSWLYSQRRYNTYDYLNFVGMTQWPTAGLTRYATAYRQFYLDNRERTKGQFSVGIDLFRGVTVTPTLGWRNDDFNIDDLTEEGLKRDHSLDAGVEVAYLMAPDTRVLLSYMNERHSQVVKSAGNTFLFTADTLYEVNVADRVNTFVASLDHVLIPDQMNVELRYTVSKATDSQPLFFANGTIPASGQYPDVRSTFQRCEAIAKWKVDDGVVRRLGWTGEVTAKLRYAWERNSVQNWQLDQMQTYMYSSALSTAGYMTWFAYNNPNYNVHQIAASVEWKW